MHATMMDVPLSLNHLLERAGQLFPGNEIVSRLPDKTLRTPQLRADSTAARARWPSALQRLGLKKGDRVATLCWNHHAHLECYFGIPAAGGVMHTLNLRLAPDEIGWIAADAQDRFLIVDDVLLPLYRQFAHLHRFERVIVFPFSGAPVPAEFDDYEALLADADARRLRLRRARRERPGRHVLHLGHHRPAEGRGLFAPLHRAAHAGRLPGRLLGPAQRSDVLLPVTPMFHANCWGMPYGAVMMGVEAGVPRPAPAPRRPARPDAARAADAVRWACRRSGWG